jgi:hypothetical protein
MKLAFAVAPLHPMGQRTLIPDAGGMAVHELKSERRDRLVMVLRSAGEKSRCPAVVKRTLARQNDF